MIAEAVSVDTVKCGWRACDVQIEPVTPSGATRKYCGDGHKIKASAARVRKARHSTVEFRQRRTWSATGFAFAKMMEAAEHIADQFGQDPDVVKDSMVDAMSKRIALYKAERDA